MKEIKQLLAITEKLKEQYPTKHFSLDGKLVGDIGEVLAAHEYGIKLYAENNYKHDGEEIATGRKVQIKASFKNYSYFPFGDEKRPDYFLSLNITREGELEELFNGPGQFIYDHYIIARGLKHYNHTYYTLSKGVLLNLNKKVPEDEKIMKV
jgi:hypothetical protein